MADEHHYWTRRRIGRRSALGVFGAGAAALGLAACGSGSKNKNAAGNTAPLSTAAGASGAPAAQPTRSGGLLTPAASGTPVAKQPKPGGVFTFQLPTPPPSLEPYTQTSFLCSYMNGLAYSKLYRSRAGVPEVAPSDIAQEPDLAQAMPEQPEPLQFVVKLKAGVKFHNGRPLTAEDVRYAIDRYQNYEKSVHKPTWSFVDKVEVPDPQTVIVKTKFPYADFVYIAGGNLAGYISPKEHAETADAATKMVGSGPFTHTEYQTGVSLSFKKNPDYYDKPYPYADEVKVYRLNNSRGSRQRPMTRRD